MSEPHDVVKLLLARMKSHPEEFMIAKKPFHDRWDDHINEVNSYGNEVDKAALNAKLRDLRLAEIHEQVMDELCNGDERRRKEEEEHEYERNLSKSLALTQRQMVQQVQQNLDTAFASAYTNQMGVGTASSDMNPIKHLTGVK
jgi:hypothetical protein